jgi:hypothetical protein
VPYSAFRALTFSGAGHCFPQRRDQQHCPAGLQVLHAIRLRASFSSLLLVKLSSLDTTFVHPGTLGPNGNNADRAGKSPGTANLTTEHDAGVEPVALHLNGRSIVAVGRSRIGEDRAHDMGFHWHRPRMALQADGASLDAAETTLRRHDQAGNGLPVQAIETKRGAWRCKLHGGKSTGPTSAEGRARHRNR